MSKAYEIVPIEQGSPEWHNLRKTKITATDASVIMGDYPWKTKIKLFHEKLSNDSPMPPNERMQRGIDLEPIARDLFCMTTRHKMLPKVIVKDWAMASLDGINDWDEVLEIKCPGQKDHKEALLGKVPKHYFPQLQHQMYVCNSQKAFYYSFDGFDGVIVEVKRDDAYIEKMLAEEKLFYDALISGIPSPAWALESEIQECNDENAIFKMKQLVEAKEMKKRYEKIESDLSEELKVYCKDNSMRFGEFIFVKSTSAGLIDYKSIPELQGIDLEKYRKNPIVRWGVR